MLCQFEVENRSLVSSGNLHVIARFVWLDRIGIIWRHKSDEQHVSCSGQPSSAAQDWRTPREEYRPTCSPPPGIAHATSLPLATHPSQLVVVGDQSSGKSSLLESLTKIPFPRNVELCTRYATQITSRRDSESRVEVTIIPGPHASDAHKKHLEYHPGKLYPEDFRAQFSRILKEVCPSSNSNHTWNAVRIVY